MDQNVERASKLDTATLSDALDKHGIRGQCLGIQPRDHSFRMTGRAFTLKYGPADVTPGTVGDYIDDVPRFLRQAQQGPGDGILKHVLGGRREQVEAGLSRSTGLGRSATGLRPLSIECAP